MANFHVDQLASLHSAPLRYLVPLSLDGAEYNEITMNYKVMSDNFLIFLFPPFYLIMFTIDKIFDFYRQDWVM